MSHPGTDPVVFESPEAFGVLICYEAISPPRLARDLAKAGEQHFASGVFRAVETRRALARATNTGITALVGPSGRIVARFPTGTRGAWVVDVPLRDGTTFYDVTGDLFAWAAVAASIGPLVVTRRGRGGWLSRGVPRVGHSHTWCGRCPIPPQRYPKKAHTGRARTPADGGLVLAMTRAKLRKRSSNEEVHRIDDRRRPGHAGRSSVVREARP